MYNFDDLRSVKFVSGGRASKEGLDCYGLCIEIYRRLGRNLPEYSSPDDNKEAASGMISKERDKFVKIPHATAWCLVLFAIFPPYETHIGVVLEDRKSFIHVAKKVGCCIEKLDNPFWEKRIRGFYEWNPCT